MEWNIDDLIRSSLRQAAQETDMRSEDKVNMLLDVLTVYLGSKIEPKDETN